MVKEILDPASNKKGKVPDWWPAGNCSLTPTHVPGLHTTATSVHTRACTHTQMRKNTCLASMRTWVLDRGATVKIPVPLNSSGRNLRISRPEISCGWRSLGCCSFPLLSSSMSLVYAESHARASHVRDHHSYHRHYQNLLILSMVLFIILLTLKWISWQYFV